MTKQILLINPPIREYTAPTNFPIGPAYIASYLDKHGFNIEVFDIDRYRCSREEVRERIKNTESEIIGISSFVTLYSYTKWLCNSIREIKPNAKIIVGGSLPTTMADFIKDKFSFDYLVLGEGEETMRELVDFLINDPNKMDKDILGIAYWHDGKLIRTEPRPPINIDDLPFPGWKFFDMDYYVNIPAHTGGKYKSMVIFSTRGCPFRCKYCYHIFGYNPRERSISSILDEMRELKERYGVTFVAMADDLFAVNKKRVMEFCRRVKKELPGIKWDSTARINILDEETIREMKSAGCQTICVAIESASQRIMNDMNRNTTVEQAHNIVSLLQKYKLDSALPFMIGYPNEDEKSIQESVEFCKKHGIFELFNFVCPYPGTPLFYEPRIREKITDMEDFMNRIGDGRDFVINLTEYSDEQIFKMRKDAEKEMELAYVKKHIFLAILLSPVKLFGKNLAEMIKFYRQGLFWFNVRTYLKYKFKGLNKKTTYRVE